MTTTPAQEDTVTEKLTDPKAALNSVLVEIADPTTRERYCALYTLLSTEAACIEEEIDEATYARIQVEHVDPYLGEDAENRLGRFFLAQMFNGEDFYRHATDAHLLRGVYDIAFPAAWDDEVGAEVTVTGPVQPLAQVLAPYGRG